MIELTERQRWTLQLARGRAKLLYAYVGVSDESLRTLTDEGGWTLGDIFAHVAAWEQHVTGLLPAILASDAPDIPALQGDELERRAFADIRARGFEAVLDDLTRTRGEMLAVLAAASDAAIARQRRLPGGELFTARVWAIQELADHDVEHARHARAARKARGVKFAPGPKVVLEHAFIAAHDYLAACAACVPAGQEPALPITGEWTLKDVLGHLTDWLETIESAIDGAQAGRPPLHVEFTRIQEFNDAHSAARKGDTWAKVSAGYVAAWNRAQAALASTQLSDFTREVAVSERGPISLYSWLSIIPDHEIEHADFMCEA